MAVIMAVIMVVMMVVMVMVIVMMVIMVMMMMVVVVVRMLRTGMCLLFHLEAKDSIHWCRATRYRNDRGRGL